MGLIGKEIIQSTIYERDDSIKTPKGNYKNAYPITVFDAVKETWENGSSNLKEILEEIRTELRGKQPIFPPKPANYLMTYGGVSGSAGAIPITTKMQLDPSKHSNGRIPTEKAIGDLMIRLGLLDADGTVNVEFGSVRWGQILGRPFLYDELGDNENGVVTQKAITRELGFVKDDAVEESKAAAIKIINENIFPRIQQHENDHENPHAVTLTQLDGVSRLAFEIHANNHDNPHNVTKEQLGLERVENTADLDKPISTLAKNKFDSIDTEIIDIRNSIDEVDNKASNAFMQCTYNIITGDFDLLDSRGNVTRVSIPLSGTVIGVTFDKEREEIIIHYQNKAPSKIHIGSIIPKYQTKDTRNVLMKIQKDPNQNLYEIEADLRLGAIGLEHFKADMDISTIIRDKTITGNMLADKVIDTIKIKDLSITNDLIESLSIEKLKKSKTENNRVLLSNVKDEKPTWGLIGSQHIEAYAINTHHIQQDSITTDLLQDAVITESKLTNSLIKTKHLTPGLILENCVIKATPDTDSNDHTIPDTKWVTNKINELQNNSAAILDKISNVETLITPPESFLMLSSASDKSLQWGKIESVHLSDGIIYDKHIVSLNGNKIADDTIGRHHIKDQSIGLEKMAPAGITNSVLTVNHEGKFVYQKINSDFMEDVTMDVSKLAEQVIDTSKIISSEDSNRVLITTHAGTNPKWGKINKHMLENESVTPKSIFRSNRADRVLGVDSLGTDIQYLQINERMIENRAIKGHHLGTNTIDASNIKEKGITGDRLADHTIGSDQIKKRSVGRDELFTSAVPNKVLAITGVPYAAPDWLSVTTEMIEDQAITREKFFRSHEFIHPQRVLAVTAPGVPPEYIRITGDFVVDDSLSSWKLMKDLRLKGTPTLENHPDADSYNKEIPTTKWVADFVEARLVEALQGLTPNPPSTPGGSIHPSHKRFDKIKADATVVETLAENEYIQKVKVNGLTTSEVTDPSVPMGSVKLNGVQII